MAKKNDRMSKWLDMEINISDPPKYKLYNVQLSNYYKDKDKNLRLNDTDKIDELMEFGDRIKSKNTEYNDKYERMYHKRMILESKLVQTFKNKDKYYYHYLNPKTPRYHANMLFNQMIDYCIMNKYMDNNKTPLINKIMRNKFYEFCYDNSRK